MSDHRELKRLAEAELDIEGGVEYWPDESGGYFDCRPGDGVEFDYLAALKPSVVLALINEIEVLREENAKLNSDNKSMRGLIRKRHKQHQSRKQTLKHMAKKVEQK